MCMRYIQCISIMLSLILTFYSLLGVLGDVGCSCETAEYFYLEQIQSRVEKFNIDVTTLIKGDKFKDYSCFNIEQIFPFKKYFNDTPEPLFIS